MEKIAAEFSGVRMTAFVTLYARWKDSQDPRSILKDSWAGPVVEKLDFDFSQLASMDNSRFTVAARSQAMDKWVTRYLSEHPAGIVLDLGSGFDSRAFRLDPPAGHHWYDVDFPDVIAVRNQLYPEREHHTTIGASVADPDWIDHVPKDRPVIVVADSLLGFLTEDEVRDVFRRVVDHFPEGGQFVFSTYSSLVKQREAKRGRAPFFDQHDVSLQWTLDEPREVERFHDRLHFQEWLSQVDRKLHAQAPLRDRLLSTVIRTIPSAKYAGAILRYRF